MDCLVTGGAGFIGSTLVDALLERGDQVTVIDNLTTGSLRNLEQALSGGAALHEIDIRDARAVDDVFATARPELVFHLAAQADVRVSVQRPVHDADTNVLGTIAVLEAARTHGCRRFVNTSTGGGLYGDCDVLPTPEDVQIHPMAGYGQSKYAAEGYCGLYARLHGLSTISLRYGNVYGPRQDVYGEAGVVAIFCGHLLEGRAPTVFGDGQQTRDWVEVSDVVQANLLAAESELSGAVNIGHGHETSVLELLRALGDVGDRPLAEPQFAPERPGEVRRSCLDVTRAHQELGWAATVSLRDGLRGILAGLSAGA
ncbi:MAG TPA: NAD-dependent epimerase/dehydratase family protein [Chloroflexota bacterium]|nr:NAD-dependent epimerase/dehydratase family protein [Chloroflexota bacterium]